MSARITPLAASALAALAALDLTLLALLFVGPADDSRASAAPSATALNLAPAAEGPPTLKPLAAYQETLAHPLFFKSRSPYVAPPPPPPPPPPPAPVVMAPPPVILDPGLAVGGIMITRGVRKAYVFTKADRRGSWVAEGDAVQGWTVEAIDSSGARLKQDSRSLELSLYGER